MTLRVDALGVFPPPSLPDLPIGGDPAAAITGRQTIAFPSGSVEAPIYERSKLGAGTHIEGPAILTQLDATTLLPPGQTAEVHQLGALIVREAAD